MWVFLNQLDQELKVAQQQWQRSGDWRVIYNSQIHSETNSATQQVSHSFLCNNSV